MAPETAPSNAHRTKKNVSAKRHHKPVSDPPVFCQKGKKCAESVTIYDGLETRRAGFAPLLRGTVGQEPASAEGHPRVQGAALRRAPAGSSRPARAPRASRPSDRARGSWATFSTGFGFGRRKTGGVENRQGAHGTAVWIDPREGTRSGSPSPGREIRSGGPEQAAQAARGRRSHLPKEDTAAPTNGPSFVRHARFWGNSTRCPVLWGSSTNGGCGS